MIKTITAQKITSKAGTSKAGKEYTKYGLQDATGSWYNSFNPIPAKEGGEYKIEFEEGQYGNDLKSIEPVSETENQVANKNRNTSIVRQHSQEMAIRMANLAMILGLKEITDVKDTKELMVRISEMTDWFVEDADTELPF